jgi:biopolymer transport protein ExbD
MLPLIDIVFLLLVFFIYAMLSMAVHRGLQLDLPESGQAEVSKESPLKLFVRSGSSGTPEISVNEQRVSTSELEHYLMTLQDTSKLPRVLLFAEEEISYHRRCQ